MEFVLALLLVGILWMLGSLLGEMHIVRTLLELSPSKKKYYEEQLNALDDKIHVMQLAMMVTEIGPGQTVDTVGLEALLKERKNIMEERRKNILVHPQPYWSNPKLSK